MRLFLGASLAVLSLLAGCLDNYHPQDRTDHSPKELKITYHVGGTQRCTLIRDGIWYQSQGTSLLVIDTRSGKTLRTESVRDDGQSGPISDMLWSGNDLVVVLDESGVARLDLSDPRVPTLIEVIDASVLGIRPRELSMVGGEIYVSGVGGAVRLSDRHLFLAGKEKVGRVVQAGDSLVAPVERRVLRINDGSFVGAATLLVPLPASAGIPGGMAFALQSREGATIGLMGPDVREIISSAVPGHVRNIRYLNGRVWVVTDTDINTWALADGTLSDPFRIAVKGARDLDAVNDNYYAVAGSFGRAMLRFRDDSSGPGDEFIRPVREPGRVDTAFSDSRSILVNSAEGSWLYQIRGKAKLTDKVIDVANIPPTKASAVWGSAQIIPEEGGDPNDLRVLQVTVGQQVSTWRPELGGRLWVIEVVNGDLWVGHDHGITILRSGVVAKTASPDAATRAHRADASQAEQVTGPFPLSTAASLRLDGPVTHVFPLQTGLGASWVSHWGGLGVAEWVPLKSDPKKPGDSSSRSTSVAGGYN